ncbi:MAG: preprotein translocase subunit SecG [Pseudomonadota bacterium]
MENVVLIIHLLIALCLIGVVLLQRSEGGALGIGGGGGGLVSARGAGNALTKLTWGLATAFIVTSITLTILSGGGTERRSVTDNFRAPLTDDVSIPLPDLPATGDEDGDGGLSLPGLGGDGGSLLPPPAAE